MIKIQSSELKERTQEKQRNSSYLRRYTDIVLFCNKITTFQIITISLLFFWSLSPSTQMIELWSSIILFHPGLICILDIDIQGVKSIKETDISCNYIFVQPPSMEVLKQRLQGEPYADVKTS